MKMKPECRNGFHLPSRDMAIKIRDLIQSSPVEDKTKRYLLRNLFRRYLPGFLERYGKTLTPYKTKCLRSIALCGSGELGYVASICQECGEVMSYTPRSCGNSNCPCCGHLRREKWVLERQSELIEGMSYLHLVFTIPHELNDLIYNNQKLLLDLLFHSAQGALLDLSMEKHGIKPGIVMILHTFGSSMTLHYHLHVLISSGGLTADNSEFKRIKGFFLPVQLIAAEYRKRYMTQLKEYYRDGRLSFGGGASLYQQPQAFHELCDLCYKALWNVNLKPYGSFKADAEDSELPKVEKAVEYFARYANRTAIAPSRIKDVSDEGITFEYKDYRTDGTYEKKLMTVTPDEFIRRFALHILPKWFRKIRMAGYLSGNVRRKNLELIHKLLKTEYVPSPVRGMKSAELMQFLYHEDISRCTKCQSLMQVVFFHMDRSGTVDLKPVDKTEGWDYTEYRLFPRGPDHQTTSQVG